MSDVSFYHGTRWSCLARWSIQTLVTLRERHKGRNYFLTFIFFCASLIHSVLSLDKLTAGPGIPLRPWGPGLPGCPWAPTGPVFPMGPSKPGAP